MKNKPSYHMSQKAWKDYMQAVADFAERTQAQEEKVKTFLDHRAFGANINQLFGDRGIGYYAAKAKEEPMKLQLHKRYKTRGGEISTPLMENEKQDYFYKQGFLYKTKRTDDIGGEISYRADGKTAVYHEEGRFDLISEHIPKTSEGMDRDEFALWASENEIQFGDSDREKCKFVEWKNEGSTGFLGTDGIGHSMCQFNKPPYWKLAPKTPEQSFKEFTNVLLESVAQNGWRADGSWGGCIGVVSDRDIVKEYIEVIDFNSPSGVKKVIKAAQNGEEIEVLEVRHFNYAWVKEKRYISAWNMDLNHRIRQKHVPVAGDVYEDQDGDEAFLIEPNPRSYDDWITLYATKQGVIETQNRTTLVKYLRHENPLPELRRSK